MIWNLKEAYFVYITKLDTIKIMDKSEIDNLKKIKGDKYYSDYKVMPFENIITEEEIQEIMCENENVNIKMSDNKEYAEDM